MMPASKCRSRPPTATDLCADGAICGLPAQGALHPGRRIFSNRPSQRRPMRPPRRRKPSTRRSMAPTSSRTVPRPMPGIPRSLSSMRLRKLKPDATAEDLRGYFRELKGVAGINGFYDFKAVPNRGLDEFERRRHALGCGGADLGRGQPSPSAFPARNEANGHSACLSLRRSRSAGSSSAASMPAIALGFSLVYRVTGAINLSQGGFALVAAMIGYTFGVAWGWPLAVAIPAAVIATVIIGVCLGGLHVRPGADAPLQCQRADADRRHPHHDRGIFARGLGQPALCDATVLGRATAGVRRDPDSDASVLGVRRDRLMHRRALVSHRPNQTRQGSSRLRRESFRRESDGHRRAADDAAELWPGDADRARSRASSSRRPPRCNSTPAACSRFPDSLRRRSAASPRFPARSIGGLFLGLVTQLSTAYISSLFSSAISLVILLVVLTCGRKVWSRWAWGGDRIPATR